MKHFGDVTKLSGYELPPVDCICGGSPCQDLSTAGNRAGLAGERSGLFMEQVRIIKEMRENDRAIRGSDHLARPRYMVWENVEGALSSPGKDKRGEDFRAVLTEVIRIAEPDAPVVPLPDKGKWPKSGCLYDDMGGWSVAWRVHDAQFWGVAQRRRRVSLVADFSGLSAPEVLFERKGLYRDNQTIREKTKEVAGKTENGIGNASVIGIDHAMLSGATDRHTVFYDAYQHHNWREAEICNPLTAGQNDGVRGDTPLVYGLSDHGCYNSKPGTLRARGGDYGGGSEMLVAQTVETNKETSCAVDFRNGKENYKTNGTLQAKEQGYNYNSNNTIRQGRIVRRLTPVECERLQGFPDNWTDIGEWTDTKGKTHKESSDAARYKALGNSIALPFWFWLLRRISAQYERPATLGSLFDGIGGFPLCWERCNGKGTALWASEIEEFPIAVTKRHFPE